MKPSLRVVLPIVLFSITVGLLGVCGVGQAQDQKQSGTGKTAKAKDAAGPKKPTRKPDQLLTSDPVALLAVRKAPPYIASPAVEAPGPKEAGSAADDTDKKAAEIASLEKQIQDKQKRIVLLMRLFVDDERQFLNDPAHPKGDEASQDRRKYEQDELLWETSELAKLKARLNDLTAAMTEVRN